MMLTDPHKIVKGEDTSNKAHHEHDKVYMVFFSDCSLQVSECKRGEEQCRHTAIQHPRVMTRG